MYVKYEIGNLFQNIYLTKSAAFEAL